MVVGGWLLGARGGQRVASGCLQWPVSGLSSHWMPVGLHGGQCVLLVTGGYLQWLAVVHWVPMVAIGWLVVTCGGQ